MYSGPPADTPYPGPTPPPGQFYPGPNPGDQPFPGPMPTAQFPPMAPQYPPAPPWQQPPPKRNTGAIVVVCIAAVVTLVAVAGGLIYWTTKPSPSNPTAAHHTSTPSYTYSTTYSPYSYTPTTTVRPPAPLAIGQCIAVDSSGKGSTPGDCEGGGAPYQVMSVDYGSSTCADPSMGRITMDGYSVCLTGHLVYLHCYTMPPPGGGWMQGTSACRTPGTFHVIAVLPGATSSDACSPYYRQGYWNWNFVFHNPNIAYCVLRY